MNKEEIKIITLGDIFRNLETEEQAFEFLKYIKNLQQENQELKKQLEDKTEDYKRMKDNFDSKVDVLTKIDTQQKEFISYLEDEINKFKEQIKNYDIWHEVGTDINFLILKKQFYLEILQKYKEIIGDDK